MRRRRRVGGRRRGWLSSLLVIVPVGVCVREERCGGGRRDGGGPLGRQVASSQRVGQSRDLCILWQSQRTPRVHGSDAAAERANHLHGSLQRVVETQRACCVATLQRPRFCHEVLSIRTCHPLKV